MSPINNWLLCAFSSGIPSVCKQVVSVETTRDIAWATYTCPLGFHVFGNRSPHLKCLMAFLTFLTLSPLLRLVA